MDGRITLEDRFVALVDVIDGNDWGAEKIAVILGCSVQRARYFCRNDFEIRTRKLLEKEKMFAEKMKK